MITSSRGFEMIPTHVEKRDHKVLLLREVLGAEQAPVSFTQGEWRDELPNMEQSFLPPFACYRVTSLIVQ